MRPAALVTGAGRGIGRAVAEALAGDARVAGLDLAFPEGGPETRLEVDVRDRAAVDDAVRALADQWGGIDWVVCAAGITRDRVSWKMDDDEWHDVLDVNLTGAFHVARAATPYLRRSHIGRLVFIGSINGLRGRFGQANYAASKAGLTGLARTLALELARDRVTVNVIAPGFIDTAMTRALSEEARAGAVQRTPLGRLGEPADIAAAVRFLCGAEAGFVTGVVLPVDGGQLLGGMP